MPFTMILPQSDYDAANILLVTAIHTMPPRHIRDAAGGNAGTLRNTDQGVIRRCFMLFAASAISADAALPYDMLC